MEVRLRGVPGSGADKTYALSTQARGGRLGVLLQTADGGPRYMLSDSVSGVDLAPDEFIGRVRVVACEHAAVEGTLRLLLVARHKRRLGADPCRLLCVARHTTTQSKCS